MSITRPIPGIVASLLLAGMAIMGCRESQQPTGPSPVPQDTAGAPYTSTARTAFTISSFYPDSGIADTEVEIRGKGFGSDPKGITVRFGGAEAAIISISNTFLRVHVPAHAASGPIAITRGDRTARSAGSFKAIPSFYGRLYTDNIAHTYIDSLTLGQDLRVTTGENVLRIADSVAGMLLHPGSRGIDTIMGFQRTGNVTTSSMTIVVDKIGKRIISFSWSAGGGGTNLIGRGSSHDSYSESFKFLDLNDLSCSITDSTIVCRIDAGTLRRNMIEYNTRSFLTSSGKPNERDAYHLIGLAPPRSGGYISLTIANR